MAALNRSVARASIVIQLFVKNVQAVDLELEMARWQVIDFAGLWGVGWRFLVKEICDFLCRKRIPHGDAMKPRERRETGEQDLFRSRLDQIIDLKHPLVALARAVDWGFLENEFGAVYTDGPGQPPLPTRLMAGPHHPQIHPQSVRRGAV